MRLAGRPSQSRVAAASDRFVTVSVILARQGVRQQSLQTYWWSEGVAPTSMAGATYTDSSAKKRSAARRNIL